MLDALFGVRRTGKSEPRRIRITAPQWVKSKGGYPVSVTDPSYKPDTAKAWASVDGVNLFFERKVGNGRAILLNFAITAYTRLRTRGKEMPMRGLIKALYERGGVSPRFRVTRPSGEPFRAYSIAQWGEANRLEVIGLMPEGTKTRTRIKPEKVIIHLPQESFVYEAKRGRYLGRRKEIRTSLIPERMKFFALLAGRAGKLRLSLSKQVVRGGEEIELRTSFGGPVPEVSVVRVQAFSRTGKEGKWWRRNVVVDGGRAVVTLRIAYDEEPGRWIFKARDLLTGQTADAKLRIEDTNTSLPLFPRCLE